MLDQQTKIVKILMSHLHPPEIKTPAKIIKMIMMMMIVMVLMVLMIMMMMVMII